MGNLLKLRAGANCDIVNEAYVAFESGTAEVPFGGRSVKRTPLRKGECFEFKTSLEALIRVNQPKGEGQRSLVHITITGIGAPSDNTRYGETDWTSISLRGLVHRCGPQKAVRSYYFDPFAEQSLRDMADRLPKLAELGIQPDQLLTADELTRIMRDPHVPQSTKELIRIEPSTSLPAEWGENSGFTPAPMPTQAPGQEQQS